MRVSRSSFVVPSRCTRGRYSFVFGGTVAALFIFFFAWIGIYGAMAGVGGKPADVANHISPTVLSWARGPRLKAMWLGGGGGV